MKILMITPDSQMIDRRIILEAKTLVGEGHSVTLLAGFECEKEEEYYEHGIHIYRYKYDWDDERLKLIRQLLPDNDSLKMFVNRLFMKVARTLFEINPFEQFMLDKLMKMPADVIHVHDLPCLKVAAHAAKKKGVPLIYDAHELYHAQESLSTLQRRRYLREEKKYISFCSEVITVNPFIAEILSKIHGVQKPKVIMNCTELPEGFSATASYPKLRQAMGLQPGTKIVLYQGWISPERNLSTIVSGTKYFPDNTVLAIIGYGAYEKTLREIVKREKLEERVYFLGQVPSDEMLTYTVGADVGIIPYQPIDDNHLYCSPNKLFEYVLAHLPIVTNRLPFFELMQKTYGFLTFADLSSPKEFAKKIDEILSSNKIQEMRSACIEAAEVLNWKVEGKKLLDIYADLVV